MQIHLVDGTYELFRAFYGPPGVRFDGKEVGATRAFFRSMAALLKEAPVTHAAVAFDTRIESFRNDLFDGYKTGAGIDPELFAQFPWVELAARALGMTVWSMWDYEADDGMCAAAHHMKQDPAVEKVWLCSPDKDLYQCVDEECVRVRDRMRRKTIDVAAVREKFGIEPGQVPDFLALVGDSADGIPGIPRWGQKSAATVLGAYGTIEDIPDDETVWTVKVRGAKALAENLRDRREAALLYKTLATLRTDAEPTAKTPQEIAWSGLDADALDELVAITGDEGAREVGRQVVEAMAKKGVIVS